MRRELLSCFYCKHDGSNGYSVEIEFTDDSKDNIIVSILCRLCGMITFDTEMGSWEKIAAIGSGEVG